MSYRICDDTNELAEEIESGGSNIADWVVSRMQKNTDVREAVNRINSEGA